MRRAIAVGLVVLGAGLGLGASEVGRLREIRRHALVALEGESARFTFHYFSDPARPDVCVLIVRDGLTGQFSAVSGTARLCDPVMVYERE